MPFLVFETANFGGGTIPGRLARRTRGSVKGGIGEVGLTRCAKARRGAAVRDAHTVDGRRIKVWQMENTWKKKMNFKVHLFGGVRVESTC